MTNDQQVSKCPVQHQAELCAATAPPTSIGALVVIEIIYYSFKLWQACRGSAAPTSMGARACIRKAARRCKTRMSYREVQDLHNHMANHVEALPVSVLEVCCATPPLPPEESESP